MRIYYADNSCKAALDKFGIPIDKRPECVFQPEDMPELLMAKKLLLVDVFDTFIEPIVTLDEDRTYTRRGIEAFMRTRAPRAGFHEFLEYYHGRGKAIGIHSDAITKEEFDNIRKTWSFDRYVDRYFERAYAKCADESRMYDERSWIKDFGRMMVDLKSDREQTLVIGDGASDIRPAIYFDVDLLLVPSFYAGRDFDYRVLIPK